MDDKFVRNKRHKHVAIIMRLELMGLHTSLHFTCIAIDLSARETKVTIKINFDYRLVLFLQQYMKKKIRTQIGVRYGEWLRFSN